MYGNQIPGLSAGTGKLCIFGHLGLVFIWSCFVSCLLLLLYYVICAPVLTEGTQIPHPREYTPLFGLGGYVTRYGFQDMQ